MLISHIWGEKEQKPPTLSTLRGGNISISCFINIFQIHGNYSAQGGWAKWASGICIYRKTKYWGNLHKLNFLAAHGFFSKQVTQLLWDLATEYLIPESLRDSWSISKNPTMPCEECLITDKTSSEQPGLVKSSLGILWGESAEKGENPWPQNVIFSWFPQL